MRLVGGTALALQIGHRKSIDLDFFGAMQIDGIDLSQELRIYGTVSTRNIGRRIQCFMVNNVQVDFVEYPYPWLDSVVSIDDLKLASCRDIAAMKLSAITNRGTKKDFVDFVFLLEIFSLEEMLGFYTDKYSDGNILHILKSLVFFDDAENEPMPNMLEVFNWDTAKQKIIDAVTSLSNIG
jgi:predicted nucleotidyltransferase component of viral defense system